MYPIMGRNTERVTVYCIAQTIPMLLWVPRFYMRAHEVTTATSRWHGSQRQYVPTSWAIFTQYILQVLGGMDAMGIEVSRNSLLNLHRFDKRVLCKQMEVRALGATLFSMLNAACTLSTYGLYFIAVSQSTESWLQAVMQLVLLLMLDVAWIGRNVRRMYARMIEENATLEVILSRR